DLPGGAADLVVGVIANGPQQNGDQLIAGHVALGVVVAVAHTHHQVGVGRVVHVAGKPVAGPHVGEHAVVGIDVHLIAGDVASHDPVDQGGHLSAGDVALGVEVVLGSPEDVHTGQDLDSLGILRADLVLIRIVIVV